MREIRLSGLEGGGAGNRSPYPYPILKGKASLTAGFHALADQLRTLTLAGIDAVGNGRGFSTSWAPIDGKPTKVERCQVTDSSPPRP